MSGFAGTMFGSRFEFLHVPSRELEEEVVFLDELFDHRMEFFHHVVKLCQLDPFPISVFFIEVGFVHCFVFFIDLAHEHSVVFLFVFPSFGQQFQDHMVGWKVSQFFDGFSLGRVQWRWIVSFCISTGQSPFEIVVLRPSLQQEHFSRLRRPHQQSCAHFSDRFVHLRLTVGRGHLACLGVGGRLPFGSPGSASRATREIAVPRPTTPTTRSRRRVC